MKFLLEIAYDAMRNTANPALIRALSGISFLTLACLMVWLVMSVIMAANAYKDKIDAEIDCMLECEEESACEEETAVSESMQ